MNITNNQILKFIVWQKKVDLYQVFLPEINQVVDSSNQVKNTD